MKIACLSGKGGAGKTFIAVNLAYAFTKATYIDCDTEEPNGRLFLKPINIKEEKVEIPLPSFDETKCTGCKKCVQFCRFHALMYIKEKPMVFPEVCHSCGGCMLVCPSKAITEKPKAIGSIETGYKDKIKVVTGILDPGEATGVPVIRRALKEAEGITVIDCPPGSACSVMESITDADLCLLVAEPTAFGFHNFKMVLELTELLNKRVCVVINKFYEPYEPMEEYLKEKGIPVIARIPYDEEAASIISQGQLIAEKSEKYLKLFRELMEKAGAML